MYYFYSMRQLDLFGSLFDTAPPENKPADDQPVLKKEEEVLPVLKKDETPFSLVEIAEETLGGNDVDGQTISFNTDTPGSDPAADAEKKLIPSFANDTANQKHREVTGTEELQIEPGVSIEVNDLNNEEKTVGEKDADQLKPPRSGAVIFDDGKISVKVKLKPLVPVPAVENIREEDVAEKAAKVPQKRGRKPIKEIEAEADLIEVPEDEVLFQKQYYSISEVAKWFRVNTSLLRFWENEFDILKPRKNRKGDRLFRPEDVKSLQLIYQLLRQRKYTIEGAKEYIKTNRKKADIELQLTNSLQKFKSFLLDLKANLQ